MEHKQTSDSEEEQFEDAVENLTVDVSNSGKETPRTVENIAPNDLKFDGKSVSSDTAKRGVIAEVSPTEQMVDNSIDNGEPNTTTPISTHADDKESPSAPKEHFLSKSGTDQDELNVLLNQDDSCSSENEESEDSSDHTTEPCFTSSDNVPDKCDTSEHTTEPCTTSIDNTQDKCDTSDKNEYDPVDEALGTNEEQETKEESEIIIDEESIRQKEALLTEEEREARRKTAQELKEEGNTEFKNAGYEAAIDKFTAALAICPLCYAKDRSIMYSNRGACKYRMEKYESCVTDSSKALELNPKYLKALLRRAECYEKTDKLDEALEDYNKALEMDPSLLRVREACMRLPEEIKERNEKMKAEMLDKLKDLGNMVLRPFGLSTNNFQMNQDPNTGGYSMNFVQNPGNGNKNS